MLNKIENLCRPYRCDTCKSSTEEYDDLEIHDHYHVKESWNRSARIRYHLSGMINELKIKKYPNGDDTRNYLSLDYGERDMLLKILESELRLLNYYSLSVVGGVVTEG